MKVGKTEKVLFTITIDTECDHDPNWARSRPLRFDSVTVGLPERLQPVFREAGAVPTYLLTVEVMEDASSVHALRSLQGEHELGTHLHSAFIEPEKKFFDYAGIDSPDFQCHCGPEVEYQKLRNLSDLFERCFGYRPRSFRAGRYGAGANTISSLERLGYDIDTSVTPYIRWRHPDGDVDYRDAPEQPYYPAPGTLTRVADSVGTSVLEIPVTMRPRLIRGPRWLRPWFSSVETMKDIVHYQLRRHRDRQVVVLNMMFHSMEIIAKASPYPQTEGDVQRFLDDLAAFLDWCRSCGFVFAASGKVKRALADASDDVRAVT
ncbi:MAG: hypothetical protein AMJ84_00750 [Acidithiobacillales bacterium SM23_46]|jgi:hypothetical protein|nr:MAG: hypothetical protein AMS22_00365 [Thiotrichales bacterium SG8_50]KPK74089.1 MAG: hypothetical protein AMJ84_00750 [Acidithiobacillales bacterium SM23_46]KPL25760.1 MAG: hypothetical protein AMJ72_13370 [Acidithiobacillales bacterium SM1_46]